MVKKCIEQEYNDCKFLHVSIQPRDINSTLIIQNNSPINTYNPPSLKCTVLVSCDETFLPVIPVQKISRDEEVTAVNSIGLSLDELQVGFAGHIARKQSFWVAINSSRFSQETRYRV